MNLGEEIEYIISHMVEGKNIKLSADDITYAFKRYIGIGNEEIITMDEICQIYNFPIKKGSLSNYFYSYFQKGINKIDTPITDQINHYIENYLIATSKEFCFQLNSLTGEKISYKGYSRFFEYIQHKKLFVAVDINFTEVRKFDNTEHYFILKRKDVKNFLDEAKDLKKNVVKHGLLLEEELLKYGIKKQYLEAIKNVYKLSGRYKEVVDKNQKKWIMFENEDNIIINTLRKIIPLAEKQEIEVLADILSRASQRTTKFKNAKADIYIEYLRNTSYIDIVKWNLKGFEKIVPFTKYDIAILRYFAKDLSVRECTYTDLKIFFQLSGENDASIHKISWSTVVSRYGNKGEYIYKPIFSSSFIADYYIEEKNVDFTYWDFGNEMFDVFKEIEKISKSREDAVMVKGRRVYPRKKEISKNALVRAEHRCEYSGEHYIFKRKDGITGYTEPHHLVPLKFQDDFIYSLDREQNIVSLCSSCHNLIHYGADKNILLDYLYDKRKGELYEIGIEITLKELKKMYE